VARYARVIFPRHQGNPQLLYAPDVARGIDEAPLLQPRVSRRSIAIDVEMLEHEQLPDAEQAIAARAIGLLRDAGEFTLID
jgi:hypothetical protein